VKFVTYKTERDREQRARGRVVEGQVISGAAPSGSWVLCPDEPPARRFHRVYGTAVHGNPLPEGSPAPRGSMRSSLESEARRG
jgi:hypothetical protein